MILPYPSPFSGEGPPRSGGGGGSQPVLRLGLREVDGLREEDALLLFSQREKEGPAAAGGGRMRGSGASNASSGPLTLPLLRNGPLPLPLGEVKDVPVPALEKLAAADAFRSVGLDRRAALWEVKGLAKAKPLPLFDFADARDQGAEEPVTLPEMPLSEHVVNDYQTLKLSLKGHPLTFLRALCTEQRVTDNRKLKSLKSGAYVSVAGVVLIRQRPGSAKGVVFLTLEDEFSVCNVVVWPKVLDTHRSIVMGARLMLVRGRVQRAGDIIHVVANRIEDRTAWLALLTADREQQPQAKPAARHPRQMRVLPKSRDFH